VLHLSQSTGQFQIFLKGEDMDIDWSKQHSGVRKAGISTVLELMPDLAALLATFPDNASSFTWDVKVHMLMPDQFSCIPNWHHDCLPALDGIPQLHLARPELPMYLWISGSPLTEFDDGFVEPCTWHRFNQLDRHRGTASTAQCWRGFLRAVHSDLVAPNAIDHFRRHSQVYLDASNYQC
jgi:hypothetical protein